MINHTFNGIGGQVGSAALPLQGAPALKAALSGGIPALALASWLIVFVSFMTEAS